MADVDQATATTIPPPPSGFVPVDTLQSDEQTSAQPTQSTVAPVAATGSIPPPPPGFVPAPPSGFVSLEPKTDESIHPEPGVLEKAGNIAQELMDMTPEFGIPHQLGGALKDWATKKLQSADTSLSPVKTGVLGVLKDIGATEQGVNTPSSVAIAGGAMSPAAPLVGLGLFAHGSHGVVSGWGDLVKPNAPGQDLPWYDRLDPDVVGNVANSAAEAIGGATLAGESGVRGVKAIKTRMAEKAAVQAPVAAMKDFMTAIPPSKTAPYNEADYNAARPYMEEQHSLDNISSPEETEKALNKSLDKIENHISSLIASNPDVPIKTSPIDAIRQKLSQNPDTTFLQRGLDSLERFKLGYERAGGVVDPPLTLETADKLRWQLNQEMKGVLKKNNYDVATARAVDPGFAASEAATEALRDGVYRGLKDLGYDGIDALRLTEGSIIKLRNAANRQMFKGEKPVASTGKVGPIRNATGNLIRMGSAAAGGSIGGGPGAVIGQQIGDTIARTVTGANPLTRNQLIERSFSHQIHPPEIGTPETGPIDLGAEREENTIGQPPMKVAEPTALGGNFSGALNEGSKAANTPDWVAGEFSHEIDRLEKIVRNPESTAEEKAIAGHQLQHTRELAEHIVNPNQGAAEVAPASTDWMPEAGTKFYHGTKADVSDVSQLDASSFSKPNSLMGLGTYFTDNPEVASGYAQTTKGTGAGKVLGAKLPEGKYLNAELSVSPEVREAFQKAAPSDAEKLDGNTARELFNSLRESYADAGWSTNDAMDGLQDLTINLRKQGFDGLRYEGGKTKLGQKYGPHNVAVVFPDYEGNPVKVEAATPSRHVAPESKLAFAASKAGLEYKGSLEGGNGQVFHTFDDPTKPGDQITVRESELPATGVADFLKQKMEEKRSASVGGGKTIEDLRKELLANVNEPKGKLLEIPASKLPPMYTTESTIRHELGHALEGDRVGIPVVEIRSHLHPALTGNESATAHLDFSQFYPDEKGHLPIKNIAPIFVDRFLPMYTGGAVINSILDDIPVGMNRGLSGDFKNISAGLKHLGFSVEDANEIVKSTINEQKNRLTNDPALDILKKYAATREEGLSDTLHVSADRIKQFRKDVAEARKGTPYEIKPKTTGNIAGSAGTSNEVVRQPELRSESPGAKGNLREGNGKAVQIVNPSAAAGLSALAGSKVVPSKPIEQPETTESESEPLDLSAGMEAKEQDIPALLSKASKDYGVPEDLLYAQAMQESKMNPNAESNKGAKGVMQLMDQTSRSLGVTDPKDPAQNVDGGARLMKQLLDRFNGDQEKALASYDWNPTSVDKAVQEHGHNWLSYTPKETQTYVRKIMSEKYKQK